MTHNLPWLPHRIFITRMGKTPSPALPHQLDFEPDVPQRLSLDDLHEELLIPLSSIIEDNL